MTFKRTEEKKHLSIKINCFTLLVVFPFFFKIPAGDAKRSERVSCQDQEKNPEGNSDKKKRFLDRVTNLWWGKEGKVASAPEAAKKNDWRMTTGGVGSKKIKTFRGLESVTLLRTTRKENVLVSKRHLWHFPLYKFFEKSKAHTRQRTNGKFKKSPWKFLHFFLKGRLLQLAPHLKNFLQTKEWMRHGKNWEKLSGQINLGNKAMDTL